MTTHETSIDPEPRFCMPMMLQWAKDAMRRLLWSAGFDLRRRALANTEDNALKNLLAVTSPLVVLDVGANVGQFGERLRFLGYGGPIVSFEAIPHVHRRLQERARRDGQWQVAPCAALGSTDGAIQINISANTQSSSLLKMLNTHRDAAPESAYVSQESVQLRRLDETALTYLPRKSNCSFLKIDTQGYEREVLSGSTRILDRIASIQVEMSLAPVYEGAPSFVEMISYVEALGFGLFDIVPCFKDLRTGRVLQVDGFFMRKEFLSC